MARLRFILALGLFVGWMGWLGFLAFETKGQVVLARPQFLVSNLDVRATLSGADDFANGQAVLIEVLAFDQQAAGLRKGTRLKVKDLELCGRNDGWVGPGEYILALTWRRSLSPEETAALAAFGSPVARVAAAVLPAPSAGPVVSLTPIPVSPGYPVSPRVSYSDFVRMKAELDRNMVEILQHTTDAASARAARLQLRRLFPHARILEDLEERFKHQPPTAAEKSALDASGATDEIMKARTRTLDEIVRIEKMNLPETDELLQTFRSFDTPEEGRLRIYPATQQTLEQFRHMQNSWK